MALSGHYGRSSPNPINRLIKQNKEARVTMPFIVIGVGLLGVVSGLFGGAYLQQRITQRRIAASERSAARILNEAERRQKEILLEAKEDALRFRQQAEAELKERRKEVQRLERRISQKEENLDRKLESLEQRQRNLQNKEAQLDQARSELQEIEEQRKQEMERASGVDVIIDDTPDAVTLSGFDPVRREIARVALTKLLTDGRIHPARIEEMVEKARKDVEVAVKEAGEEAAVEAGCPGLHPEVSRTLGRLKYRYSYGQNQLNHAVETANLAAMIAHELGANVEVARRGGLLHDLGKAIDHDVEGTHAAIGAELGRRHNVHA